MLLLEKEITTKKQIERDVTRKTFEANKSEEYKFQGICDSMIYARKSKDHYLPGF